jgi:hypothetical protein
VRQGAGSVKDWEPPRASRSPQEEQATRAERYKRVAALLDQWRAEDEASEPLALDAVAPLRLRNPSP